MGIIGYGNIGTQVSILAESMGMKVVFYDIETKLPLGNAVAKKSLKEVVSIADIVTVHVPDTDQTRLMINKNVIRQTKKGGILLNYAFSASTMPMRPRAFLVRADALTVHRLSS